MPEAFIFEALRTPRGKGKAGGALYELKPIDLLSTAFNALNRRLEFNTEEVDDVIIGCVTPVDDQGGNIAKAALLHTQWSDKVPAMQINRLCSSGLDAVNLAAMKVRSGWEELIIAGGLESMSRVPMESDGGPILFDPELATGVCYVPQGVAADLLATINEISREEADQYALLSQQRAQHAMENGYFEKSIIPIKDKNGLVILNKDEDPRPDTDLDELANLPPAFSEIGQAGFDAMALKKYPFVEQISHIHTAGNSSGKVDGAALTLIGSKEKGESLGLKPRARILSAATVGTDPTLMLDGPIPACHQALSKAGMKTEDIDLWEMNESFAAPVIHFQREMAMDIGKLNVNGGAIAFGHPFGATGAMMLSTLIDELERRDMQTGCVCLCVGAGMGVATIIERT